MKKIILGLIISLPFSVYAGDLNCTATKIITKGGVKRGDKISFNSSRTQVTGSNGYVDSCEKAPRSVVEQFGASDILGCGTSGDQDTYIIHKDGITVELLDIAIFTCK